LRFLIGVIFLVVIVNQPEISPSLGA